MPQNPLSPPGEKKACFLYALATRQQARFIERDSFPFPSGRIMVSKKHLIHSFEKCTSFCVNVELEIFWANRGKHEASARLMQVLSEI